MITISTALNRHAILTSIYEATTDYGLLTLDLTGHVTSLNAGAERILGYRSGEILDQHYRIMFTQEDLAKGEPELEMHIAKIKERADDYRLHPHKDGSRFWATGVMTLIRDESGAHIGYLKVFRDISDVKRAETEMYRAAYTDLLTGLANRLALETVSQEKIAIALRSGQPVAVHLIDLDGFKQVNDTLGHHAGDALLRQGASRMQRVLRDSDFVARLGGDQFVVFQSSMTALHAAAELATKLINVLSQPFEIDGRAVRISASIGLAMCPNDSDDLDQLLKKADLALYRAKKDGKGRYHYFTESLDEIVHKREQEIGDLKHAVQRNEFWLLYQPKISLHTRRIIGIEALLRCAHPALRDCSMEYIVTLAIEIGVMKELSYWVLQQACRQLRTWQQQGASDVKMAVNVCSQDFTSPDLPEFLQQTIREAGLTHDDVELELTERQALDVEKSGLTILNAVRSLGIRIALDDFGTGYSALSHLKNLPITAVKLDKTFLSGIPESEQGCTIIKSVMDLAHALGLEVVAEGVETPEQAAFLKQQHCSALQGYLISRPLSVDAMGNWLRSHRTTLH